MKILYLFCLLCFGLWMPVARADSALDMRLPQLPAEGVLILHKLGRPPQIFYTGTVGADTQLPLHRLSDILVSQAVLEQMQQARLGLQEPANYHLGGDLRLQVPAGAPEVTLHDLLTRSAGFPLRQSSLFVAKAQHIQSVHSFLAEEMKPLALLAGRSMPPQSLGDLVLAQILEQLSQQPLRIFLPEYARQQGLELRRYVTEEGVPSPITPDLYGYSVRAVEMSAWLEHLMRPTWQSLLMQRHDHRSPDLPGASYGLLSQPLAETASFFYFDSDWLNQIQRIGFLPQQQMAFYLAYQGQTVEFRDSITQALIGNALAAEMSSSAATCLLPADAAGYYAPISLETRSVLAALWPFRQLQINSQGQWRPARWGADWQSAKHAETGLCQIWQTADGDILMREAIQGFGQFVRSRWFETPGFQLGSLAVLLLILSSLGLRGLRDLYLYEPQLNLGTEDETEQAERQIAQSPQAGWDLPFLGTLSSSLALSSSLLIFPALLSFQRVGTDLSVALRDQPSGWLLVALILPLVSLVLALMMLALLLTEWRSRPWNQRGGRYERLHYCLYLLALVAWLIWLSQFRLLGFSL